MSRLHHALQVNMVKRGMDSGDSLREELESLEETMVEFKVSLVDDSQVSVRSSSYICLDEIFSRV